MFTYTRSIDDVIEAAFTDTQDRQTDLENEVTELTKALKIALDGLEEIEQTTFTRPDAIKYIATYTLKQVESIVVLGDQ